MLKRFLAGCILLGSCTQLIALEEPPQVHFVVKGFVVSGDNPLSDNETDSILDKFKGDHYGLEGLQAAAEELEAALKESGYAFNRVVLVPQELKDGIIKLEVTEFKIENVSVEGNQHYNEENIRHNAPTLAIGETPNTDVLSRAINMANTQPSKNVKLQFSESETGGAINAKLSVEDSNPGFFFIGLNNTGTDETGQFRLTGGYQYSNLFNRDHSISVSYTMSPDETDAVGQFGLTYSIPFYESGYRFSLLFSDSDVDSGVVAETFEVSGRGTVLSLRLNKSFLQLGTYKQELEFGLDQKQFEDDVVLFGAIQLGGEITSRPVSVTYKGSILSTTSNIDFSIGAFANISGGNNNEEDDYNSSRVGEDTLGNTTLATADWSLLKYSFNYLAFLTDDWLFRFGLSGQETSDLLIAGEQFGLGGMNSIRGFEERDVLGDTGYQVNLEVWFPTFSSYEIRPLVFYDIGHTETLDPLAGIEPEQDPASYGAGLRYSWKDRLNATLDFGVVAKEAGTAEKGDSKAHLNVFYRF